MEKKSRLLSPVLPSACFSGSRHAGLWVSMTRCPGQSGTVQQI